MLHFHRLTFYLSYLLLLNVHVVFTVTLPYANNNGKSQSIFIMVGVTKFVQWACRNILRQHQNKVLQQMTFSNALVKLL